MDHRTSHAQGTLLLVLVVLAVALALRVVNLDADPSALISRDFITDEGQWSHNARNALVFGQSRLDDYNPGLYSAYLYHHLLHFTFSAFGMSLTAARMVSALAGWLTVVLLFDWVRRESNTRTALIAALLLGFSNLHVLYSRTGFVESTMVFFLALTLWLWSLRQRHRLFGFASGIALGLMLLTKVTAAYIVPGLALLAAIEMVRKTTRRRDALLLACGATFVGLCYVIGFVGPNFADWISYNLAAGLDNEWPGRPSDLIYTMFGILVWQSFARTPILTALFLITLGGLILGISNAGFKNTIRAASRIEVTSIALLLGYVLSVGIEGYQPERRFIPVLFLMTPCSARALDKGWRWYRSVKPETKLRAGAWFALIFALPADAVIGLKWAALGPPRSLRLLMFKAMVITVLAIISVALSRDKWPSPLKPYFLSGSRLLFRLLCCGCSLALAHQALTLWGLGNQELLSRRVLLSASLIVATTVAIVSALKFRPTAAALIIGGFILLEGLQISSWLLQPTYTLKHANQELARLIKHGDTVVTHYETLLLSSAAKSVCYRPELGFNTDAFEKFDPDYILILRRDNWRDHTLGEMPANEWPPPTAARPNPVARFDLCPTRARGSRFSLELYSLKRSELAHLHLASRGIPPQGVVQPLAQSNVVRAAK